MVRLKFIYDISKICNKYFPYLSSLIKHKRIHTGEKPYICNFEGCNTRFSQVILYLINQINQVSNLIRHKKIHIGFKPFKCEMCDKTFSSTSNLNQHMNIHNLKKKRSNYICFVGNCNKTYFYICTLKKHIQICHRNEYESIVGVFSERNFSHFYNKMRKRKLLEEKFDFVKFKTYEEEKVKSENTLAKNDQKPYFAVKKQGPLVKNGTCENVSEDRTIAHNDNYNNNIINNKIKPCSENNLNPRELIQNVNNIHNVNNDNTTISSSNNPIDLYYSYSKVFFELSEEIFTKFSVIENLRKIFLHQNENLVEMLRVKCPKWSSFDN